MNYETYWDRGGAQKLRRASGSSQEAKEAGKEIWKAALKYGRTDNKFNDLSFPEFWQAEGIEDRIDRKNRRSWFFKIDKDAMKSAVREIWNDAIRYGDPDNFVGNLNFSSKNNAF